MSGHDQLPDNFWLSDSREADDYAARDEQFGAERYPGLISLSFVRSAIKRSAKVWLALAVVGLLAGVGLYVARPVGNEATISLLMAPPPSATPGWISDDQAVAREPVVAGIALRNLGLREDPASFVSDYTVVASTDRILVLTVKATSARDALREATAVATAFLNFRANLLTRQAKLVNNALDQQVTAARHKLDNLNTQLAKLQPGSSQLHELRVQRDEASSTFTQLKQTVTNTEANTEAATQTAIKYSGPIGHAGLVKQSVKRRLALYGVGGLICGLVLGLGIVTVTAIASTRLRRRDDVARALAAPVRLSIRKRRMTPRRLRRLGLAAAQDRDLARVTTHLASAVAPAAGGFASLAVVAVGDAEIAAACLASLACSSALEGQKVVLADLCDGAPGARLLGADRPGVEEVTVDAARLTLVIPDRDDVRPGGPLQVARYGQDRDDPMLAACASADLVLTLATLDPALGGDHLAEWTSSVVVVVTAGRSSAERIHAVGEMIRLAGIDQVTAVLVGADKADESLGMPSTRSVVPSGAAPRDAAVDEDEALFGLDRVGRRGSRADS